jgi:RHS repeat-associated protein
MDINDYYPFGMSFLKPEGVVSVYDPMAIPYNYKYNGKELQETGMYDYGQRQYMPDIARFNRIDRFSEKYVNISNYSYAALNPLKYVDMRGDSLWVQHKENNILYKNGDLYNSDGSAYRGDGVKIRKDGSIKLRGFLKSAVNALNQVGSGDAGNSVVNELQNSNENYTVVQSSEGNSYDPSNNLIKFDPSSKDGGLNEKGVTSRPTYVGLGHEMGHAVDDDRGTLSKSIDPSLGYMETEKFATHIENQIRSEHNLPLRTHYGIDSSGKGQGALLNTVAKGMYESKFYSGFYYGSPIPIVRPAYAPIVSIPQSVIPNIIPQVFNP